MVPSSGINIDFDSVDQENRPIAEEVVDKLYNDEAYAYIDDDRKYAGFVLAKKNPPEKNRRLTADDIITYITVLGNTDNDLTEMLAADSSNKNNALYKKIKDAVSGLGNLNSPDDLFTDETAAGLFPLAPIVEPANSEESAEADKPAEAQKPVEADKPAEVKKPVEADKPAEVKKPVEANTQIGTNNPPATPVTASDELRTRIYATIDEKAITVEQAAEARSYADVVLNDPDAYPREFAALNDRSKSDSVIAGFLRTANKRLGFKDNGKADERITFAGGKTNQSRRETGARSAFVTPEGFGTKKATVLWNQPVITDFGFPFINFSSAALVNVLNAKTDEDAQNNMLKDMFRDAKKRYGGVWSAIYAAPLSLILQIARDKGTRCTPCYLKVDGNDLIDSEPGENISVTPIQYYSIDASYDEPVNIPRDYISNFYDVIDYSASSRRTYMKYADGMTADDFIEAVDDNGGIPPFYILVPKKAVFSRCDIRPGSLFGSLLNLILGRKPCSLVKTILDGKRGCLVMEEDIADALFADI